MTRIGLIVGAVALLVGVARAEHHHHNGSALLGDKINQPGKHHLHSAGGHHVHAHVGANHKVTGISATHERTGKAAPTRKFKTHRRHHAMAPSNGDIHYVVDRDGTARPADDLAAPELQQVVFVGYGFFDGVNWNIYWFPVDMVDGGEVGADDYDAGGF